MNRRQILVFSGIFVALAAVLLLGYLVFLRPSYVVLFEGIRAQEAAEIVAELERTGFDHRLEDGGQRILVPADAIEEARVAIAGSDIALGGVVGFELFNESDMGLTEFAQQVNYQRAIQGELARTIMMMDGIAFARVHVSLPERALFRAEQQGPRAAVTVETQPGTSLSDARVQGIQRLVASAVTDLAPQDVAVLDKSGQLVSPDVVASGADPASLDEKSALEAYYRARAEAAAAPFLAGTDFAVRVSAIRLAGSAPASRRPAAAADGASDPAAAGAPAQAARDFSLSVAVRTPFELSSADREAIAGAVATAVDLRPANGDALLFEVADLGATTDWIDAPTPASPAVADAASASPQTTTASAGWMAWLGDLLLSRWGLLLVLAVIVIALPVWRSRARMSEAERLEFADQLEAMLANRREAENG